MTTVEIEIPPLSPYVAVVRLALASLGRSADLDDEIVEDLKIAVSEACSNAVLASDRSGQQHQILVSWREEPERVTIEIDDRGATAPDGSSGESDPARTDLSAALLESLVDECTIAPGRDGGTATRLVVRRRP